ncbi:MAG: DUF1848 domain-containing protein [Lachnospiraceae bacterium]|nr:DUF1848 domain-containing protein [Lachnospiraceae bacterium]
MIINTGSRTDIPAYYSEWFYNRIKEGFVLARNPYNREQIIRYQLNPEVVDCIVFCTKNPAPMLKRLDELSSFGQMWFVTITPYGKEIEPNVPKKEEVMEAFKQLSQRAGIHAVSWRYDPIFITEQYSLEYHLDAFEKMAKNLSGYTDHCIISFIDLYEKTKRNFRQARAVTASEQDLIGKEFVKIGDRYGIRIKTCLEGTELKKYGIDVSGCVTQPVIERAIGCNLSIPKKVKPAREGCDCLLGNDIGAYNSCGHGCVYCYANYDDETVMWNMRQHDRNSPLLIGQLQEGDKAKEAEQKSYLDHQLKLFDW